MELSYSFHLGNDSNKTIKARREAKNTLSGTTNKSNNKRTRFVETCFNESGKSLFK